MTSKRKVAFIGCVQSSFEFLKTILEQGEVEVCAIISKARSTFNSDFVTLEPLAIEYSIPYLSWEDTKDDKSVLSLLEKDVPDYLFCFGWSYLLTESVIGLAKKGALGYHPTLLPANRGRHPIIWALVLGLTETGSSFFFLQNGADTGDIVSQVKVSISEEDDAFSLYQKLMKEGSKQVKEICQQINRGTLPKKPQDHSLSNCWRKRSKNDGIIDWRMDAKNIHNLTRALTRPYPGALVNFQGTEIKIWKTKLGPRGFENLEPGKVLKIENNQVLIKTGNDTIWLLDHELELNSIKVGDYL